MKTATIRARMEPELKAAAERIFRKLGISSSEAINLFFEQVKLYSGLPFSVKIPNALTRKTFEKTDRGEDLHEYPSLDDFFKKPVRKGILKKRVNPTKTDEENPEWTDEQFRHARPAFEVLPPDLVEILKKRHKAKGGSKGSDRRPR